MCVYVKTVMLFQYMHTFISHAQDIVMQCETRNCESLISDFYTQINVTIECNACLAISNTSNSSQVSRNIPDDCTCDIKCLF